MHQNIYTFASLSKGESFGFRLGGPGLGNLLFPWARSVAFAKRHNLHRINSTWRTVKLGPLLRGEFDKRLYSDLFTEHETGGLKKFLLLTFARKIPEKMANEYLENRKNESSPAVILFKGMDRLFEPIINDHVVVKEELLKMVSSRHKEEASKFDAKGISVHIRMGDFSLPPDERTLREGHWNYRLPLKWYVNVIESIRKEIGYDIEVNLFSDGTDDELKEVLGLANVHRRFFGSAIADMIALSESKLLIASASTFSMWASYLGRMPTIWYPGLHRQKLFLEGGRFEGTLDYDEKLPPQLKRSIVELRQKR